MQKRKKKKFDPEGSDYDYKSAIAAGIRADKTGHWPSREPRTGLILKGMKHKTIDLSKAVDARLGYNWVKVKGRYYSIKRRGGR